jgi:signal transduction histidine kinase
VNFTGRIRLYLILVAVIPPLAILGAVWYESNAYNTRWRESTVTQQIQTFSFLLTQRQSNIAKLLQESAATIDWSRLASGKAARRPESQPPNAVGAGLDFLELVDTAGGVLWSRGRPGLVGDQITLPAEWRQSAPAFLSRIEYDHTGQHAATVSWLAVDSSVRLYGGQYLNDDFLSLLVTLMDATIDLHFVDPDKPDAVLARLSPRELYQQDVYFVTVLTGGPESGFYLTATFSPENRLPHFLTLYIIAIVIGVVAVSIAIALGWHLSKRAEQEFDNLLAATERVAQGDLQTPLFAYDAGEFSRLADGLSDMITKLRQSQERLTATERIAAWQVMGRKIAHEIKNPLTPISLCTDDLRRSFSEGRTDFEATLKQSTTTIKNEIARMTRLLDQFVSFARMPSPMKIDVSVPSFVDDLGSLYKTEIEAGTLTLKIESERKTLLIDPEQIKQLIINLIKNAREAGGHTTILHLSDADNAFVIGVEDSGPGFSAEKLANPFEPYVSTKKDGSGLGLVICQRIAIDHGGTIEVYNRPEGGAGVRVTLPQD